MEITASDVFGLLQCPLRHAITRSSKLTPTQALNERYEEAIKETILFYHEQRLQGESPSIAELNRRFSRLWYGDVEREDFLKSRLVRKKIPAANEAIQWINYYVQAERRRTSRPIEVRRPFAVRIGKHLVRGRIDLVQEVQEDGWPKIEMASFSLARSRPSEFYVRTHLGLTLQSYAFRKLYGAEEDHLSLWWVRSGERFETHRTPKDYHKLLRQVEQAVWWARSEPTPRYGAHCNICPHQAACLEWDGGIDA